MHTPRKHKTAGLSGPLKPSTAVRRILKRLKKVASSGHGWSAPCPAHDDHDPSLSVGVGDDGRVLLKCHAGCSTEDILKELGLTWRDLFPARRRPKGAGGKNPPARTATVQRRAEPPGCTLLQYGRAKCLDTVFLRGLGLYELTYSGQPALAIPYYDESRNQFAVRFRLALSHSDVTNNRFRYRKGDQAGLYGLWRLNEARQAGYIVLVEGESDCHTLWLHKVPAVGIPGANTWNETWAKYFEGLPVIYVVVEPDSGGDEVLKWLAKSSIHDRVRLVTLRDVKDPSELHVASPGRFSKRWRKAMMESITWRDQEKLLAVRQSRAAWKDCATLASRPDILHEVVTVLRRLGVVGESRLVRLIYLAVTGRLLDRPPCITVKGPSSAGKSYVTEQTLRLFPSEAYFALTAMSQRALAYSSESLRHRTLVLYEAAGLRGETGEYLLRSLVSEGRVRYLTVEKGKNGFTHRLMERDGPTGLLLTTTRLHLNPENETRLLSVSVNDRADQTRRILLAHAADPPTVIDLAPWHALQRWLQGAEHRVAVPYAKSLAKRISTTAVRMRRDFPHLLNFIRAHALLHQAKRDRDASGRVVAERRDYQAVKALLNDVLSEGHDATVAPSVRETVRAVAALFRSHQEGVQLKDIAGSLRLDKSTTSRRVRTAFEAGYLANLEERRGRPMRIVLGERMPQDAKLLPHSRSLRA